MRTVIAFIASLLIISSAYSKTDKIIGVIRDGKDNRSLNNCKITLLKNDSLYDTKYTNEKGEFAFFRLEDGIYVFHIERKPYEPEERIVVITEPDNVIHSFSIYLQKKEPVLAVETVKKYPLKNDYEYFLLNHLYKKYETDSTILFSSTGECKWNKDHEMLYVGVMHLDVRANGEVEILKETKLLGVYEVLPDKKEPVAIMPEEEKKGKKLLSALEKMAQMAEKVVKENGGMVLK